METSVHFRVVGYEVLSAMRYGKKAYRATVEIEVGGNRHQEVSDGSSSFNALDTAIRKALGNYFPEKLKDILVHGYYWVNMDHGKGADAEAKATVIFKKDKVAWVGEGIAEDLTYANLLALARGYRHAVDLP